MQSSTCFPKSPSGKRLHGRRTKKRVRAIRQCKWRKFSSRDKGNGKFPPISRVITSPTLKPDGEQLQLQVTIPRRNYSTLPMKPSNCTPTAPTDATPGQASHGISREALLEFPFVVTKGQDGTQKHVAKAVALSALITPVVRGALSVAPLHAFRATSPGSGKSYLADVASAISTRPPVSGY